MAMTQHDTGARTRTITWHDPAVEAQRAAGMTGMGALRAMLTGELPMPPIAELMGFDGVDFAEGRAVLAVEPAEYHANNTGFAHGGLAATMLDSAMWLALHSTLPAGALCTTVQMNLNYIRPIAIGAGQMRAEGRVLHRGRTTGTAEGSMTDHDGRLYAHATTTCLVHGLP
jgi:uncharacterized protein (TIGR00369 family)